MTRTQLDFGSLLGLVVGIGAILGGLILEGGKLSDVTQLTGGMIVLGGTLGAVILTTPMPTFLGALAQMKLVFFPRSYSTTAIIDEIISFGNRARKNGIVSLEEDVRSIPDPFFRKAVSLGVDGTDVAEIKKIMEVEMHMQSQRSRWEAKVFESAGGYAPTIGIIGAVLGLIQVMKHLDDLDKVGHGIAVAFVATVYGVALANLFFLPLAGKIKARADETMRIQELILEGVCGIAQGLHPKLIEQKLEPWIAEGRSSGAKPQRARQAQVAEGRA
jgi:chemotaxis protein MotA